MLLKFETNVTIYSDKKEVIEIAKRVTQSLNLTLGEAECTTDVYAFPAFFIIADPEKLEEGFFENFEEIHELENPKEFGVLLTSETKIPRSIQKFFSIAKNNLEAQLRTLLVNKQSNRISRETDKKDLTKKLNRLFSILRKLQPKGNYIKVAELAEEYSVSEKTIKRDLQFLREVAGENIRYDLKKKAYYLDFSFLGKIDVRDDWASL